MDKSLAVVQDMSTQELGSVLAKSGYFTDARDAGQAIVKILAGRELGFGPIASMTGFTIIKGHISMSSNLMGSAIKRSGRYDYRVTKISDEACVIKFYECSGLARVEIGESAFTKADLVRAESGRMVAPGATGSMAERFPRNMLFARAMSNGVKWFCPDVLGGGPVYTPDELGQVVDSNTGEILPRLNDAYQVGVRDGATGFATPNEPAKNTSEWTHPAPKDAPDDGWSVETAGTILTPRGARLGTLTPEQLEVLINKGHGKMQSAAGYLRDYLKVRETLPTLPTATAEAVTSAAEQEVDNATPF